MSHSFIKRLNKKDDEIARLKEENKELAEVAEHVPVARDDTGGCLSLLLAQSRLFSYQVQVV